MNIECLIGIKFKDHILLASDMSHVGFGVMIQKGDDNKVHQLSDHLLMAVSGEAGDTKQFAEYIEKNIQLYKIRNNYELSPTSAAHFTRSTLATHLRSREPYAVNCLIGGFDISENKPHLYYLDYFAAQMAVDYFAFGFGGLFTLGLMDKEYDENMNKETGYELLSKCIDEIKRRFVINLARFRVYCISKDGVKEMPFIESKAIAA